CVDVDRFTQLREVMSTELLTQPAGLDPRKAFEVLHDGRHRLAPVVDDDGRLVGIMTRAGALRATLYQPAVDSAGRLRIGAALGINGDVRAGRRRCWTPGWTSWWSTPPTATRNGCSPRSARYATSTRPYR